MSAVGWILAIWAVFSCLWWSLIYLKAIHSLRSLQLLKQLQPQQPQNWPSLSVVIPACNEGDTLEQALTTLLKQDYPDLEVVLVNDRSTDNTGRIIDHMAAHDLRINPVHIAHLPAGWLGKVHALHVATQKVKADWILFTDADVHFQPGVLRKTVAFCLEQQIAHLTVAPEVYSQSFWLDVTLAAFGLTFFTSLKAAEIGKPGSDSFAGIGAFNLVRKSVFDQTEGFSWLRMEVADDLGLGLMLHRAGALSRLVLGTDEIGLTWYSSLAAMVRGLEKNLFGLAAHYRYPRLLASVVTLWLINLGWLVAFLHHQVPFLWVLGIAAYLCSLLYTFVVDTKVKRWKFAFLFIPIGQLIISAILLRSAICCFARQGIVWRGTLYPLEQLRVLQRVKL